MSSIIDMPTGSEASSPVRFLSARTHASERERDGSGERHRIELLVVVIIVRGLVVIIVHRLVIIIVRGIVFGSRLISPYGLIAEPVEVCTDQREQQQPTEWSHLSASCVRISAW